MIVIRLLSFKKFIHLKTIAQNGNRIKCVFVDETTP
jgi:hypothetical protein